MADGAAALSTRRGAVKAWRGRSIFPESVPLFDLARFKRGGWWRVQGGAMRARRTCPCIYIAAGVYVELRCVLPAEPTDLTWICKLAGKVPAAVLLGHAGGRPALKHVTVLCVNAPGCSRQRRLEGIHCPPAPGNFSLSRVGRVPTTQPEAAITLSPTTVPSRPASVHCSPTCLSAHGTVVEHRLRNQRAQFNCSSPCYWLAAAPVQPGVL